MKKGYVNVPVRLPKETTELVRALAKQGILGTTPEEVILHILRQYVFEQAQRASKR